MAVFTPVSLDEAKAYLKRYDIGEITHFEGIEEGVSNTNFKVETTAGLYAFTLFEAVTPEQDLPYFMNLTHHLDMKAYPAPGPVARDDGAVLGHINGKPCALIKWLSGRWPRNPDTRHAASAGEYLAKLHLAGADFKETRANSMGIEVWPSLIARCQPKAVHSARAEAILATFSTILADLQHNWPKDLPSGAIHADYFVDNVLMDDEGTVTGVIDYYYACTDMFAYDLAVSLNAWGFTPGGVVMPEMIKAFGDGYQSVRPLTEAEIAALPMLCIGSAMRFTLTRLYDLLNHDPTWLVKPKDPEAFYRRFEHHLAVTDGRDYL
jgi:homoserine kinase type II